MNTPVLICTSLDANGVCQAEQWVSAYLIPSDQSGAAQLFLTGGFSPEAAGIGFGGALLLFAAGLGIGFALKFIRRL
ncbi:hypothetical protein [Marinobacter mangrovi]|uniref:hypothetical protein n=1 Tax=Marinobacter mangrovi TaxID=2803918 RepID=UPI001932FC83|nr:hypothetical protein [Marinobacter mangrovi]